MKKINIKNYILEIVVFICGVSTMTLELVGTRLLAPYFGTSISIWASLIGVVLGSLSLGYWWGGRHSDENPGQNTLSSALFLAALYLGGVALFHDLILIFVQKTFSDIRIGSIFASCILFGIPNFLLGIVLPYSVRLRSTRLDKTGSTAGTLYALSTIGSIVGTFLTGFFLISYFGNIFILFLLCVILSVMSLFSHLQKSAGLKIGMIFLFSFCLMESDSIAAAIKGPGFIDVNTPYSRVWIFEEIFPPTKQPVRIMQVDEGYQSAMYLDNDALVWNFHEYFLLAKYFNPQFKKSLMIGGGAYSYPKVYLNEFKSAEMDVVEIDPKLTKLAQKYFRLKTNPRLRIFHEDARVFLNKTKNKYDIIYEDAYKSYSIPYQLTTREAVKKMYDLLNDNGAVFVNIVSAISGPKSIFLQVEFATFKSIFPHVYLFPNYSKDSSARQNIILVALKSQQKPKFFSRDSKFNELLSHRWTGEIKTDMPLLTDNFAPVDKYVMKLIGNYYPTRISPMRKRMRDVRDFVFRSLGNTGR